ncbi:MAG: ABC transporter substrate-binding protein [Pseudomonadota bacterium]
MKKTITRISNKCVVVVLVGFAMTGFAQDPLELDQTMKTKLLDILAAVNESSAESAAKLDAAIDFQAITRGVMGKHAKGSTQAQNSRFQAEFQKSMIRLLQAATETAGDYTIEVSGTKISPKNPERGQASARVRTSDGQEIDLVSSIAVVDGEWKVRNLIFAGVNLGKTYRNQFDQLVQANQGDLDQAIEAWAQQVKNPAE